MLPFIDIHTHYLKNKGHKNKDEFIEVYNASLNNIEKSNDLKSIGIHPWKIDEANDQFRILETIVEHDRSFIAIGECGLDYSIDTDISIQLEYFEQQIVLANKFKLPLIIHCVKAFNDLIRLKKSIKPSCPWIIHGFDKSPELAISLIKNGFYISLCGVLFKSKAKSILEVIPLNRLFFETDDNEKLNIEVIYKKASEITHINVNDIKMQLFLNFKSIFDECKKE